VKPVSQKGLAVGSADGAFADRADMIATYCLCAAIALVPFPFGSTSPRVIAVWVLLLSLVLGLASFRTLTSRDVLFLSGFATLAAGWAFVGFEQISVSPVLANELFNSIWGQTAVITGRNLEESISLARHQPFFSAGSQIACMLSMVCGFLLGRERSAAYLLLKTFAGAVLVYAIYGILAFAFWPDYLLWQHKSGYDNSLIATFTNRNVAAVYFGAGTIAWLLILAKTLQIRPIGHAGRRRDFVDALGHISPPTAICCAATLIVLSAMFMTGSRAGSILSLLAISGSTATLYRRQLGMRGLVMFPLYSAGTIIVAFQLFGSHINQRFSLEGFFDSERWNVYLSTLRIIQDNPWLGTGLGTFRWAFPRYRSEESAISGIWEQAHSTTIEIASEMGIPFAVLLVAGWLMVFIVLRQGMFNRKRDQILPIAAFWIGLLAAIHSQIDFSLQIPGFSLAVCTLVGMGLAQATSSRQLNPTARQAY
jgi:O-Antigen ligase